MKKVLFLTNYPSPYRVRFFDELAKYLDVTVLYTDRAAEQKDREKAWFIQGEGHFQEVVLGKRLSVRGANLCLEVLSWLKKPYDHILICGYSSPTNMLAMAYLKTRRIPFWMEVDGGLIRQEGKAKYRFKKSLISMATNWLGTGKTVTEYLVHYGAEGERVFTYPFSSLSEKDILPEPPGREEKKMLREKLGMTEEKVLLSVGQFIPRKGFDLLLQAAAKLPKTTGIYIVGGEPTEAYLQMRQALDLSNVHFVGFQSKDALAEYYRSADLFVFPTREDIWGLVVQEAMAYGLPVVTTDKCVAGLELIEPGHNGYLVPGENVPALKDAVEQALSGDLAAMGWAALETIRPYTIEAMAKFHGDLLGGK